jgi:hypothetical protein
VLDEIRGGGHEETGSGLAISLPDLTTQSS